jgi:hypothetical protein
MTMVIMEKAVGKTAGTARFRCRGVKAVEGWNLVQAVS